MGRENRKHCIEKIQRLRDNRLLIAYVTSTRPGHEVPISDDAFRLIYDHLESGKGRAGLGVDLFIHSNGGVSTVPWRIVGLIRQYTNKFSVLVPHAAFSAATLIALGADEIIMHRMGCLGPIDPSVTNVFNPQHPLAAGQLAPISVEDVTAYFKLIKDEIGITHEDELVQTVTALTEKVHPFALGNVQRSHNQSRLMARKLLKMHMESESQEHEIEIIIDNLKSNLFYHGHPISREEALKDLKLKIIKPPDDLEREIWALYSEYERDLKLTEPLNFLREFEIRHPPEQSSPEMSLQQILAQFPSLAGAGISLSNFTPEQIVQFAAALVPFCGPRPSAKVQIDPIPGAYIESEDHADVLLTDIRLEKATMVAHGLPQEIIKSEVLWQRWQTEA